MSIYKAFQGAARRKNKSLQTSEKLSAAVWLKFYVWRRYSLNKENFLSVIKILFQARKRTYDARKDMRSRITRKQSEKPFGARQCEKTSCWAFIKATHALQTSEKLSASLWLEFYVWRLHSPNKENFLSVIKTLFQARKRAYNARKDMRSRITRKQSEKPFRAR